MDCYDTYGPYWKKLNVSRETFVRLVQFVSMLRERQKRDNLFSRKESQDIWFRHVIDSAQISLFLKPGKASGADFGTGNGFPGIVLSIMRPDLTFTFVEKLQKKIDFLSMVIAELGLPVTLQKTTFSSFKTKTPFRFITARAVSPLVRLLGELAPFANRNTRLLLPKGRAWNEELDEAQSFWRFSFEAHESMTSSEARILIIKNLQPLQKVSRETFLK